MNLIWCPSGGHWWRDDDQPAIGYEPKLDPKGRLRCTCMRCHLTIDHSGHSMRNVGRQENSVRKVLQY